MIFDQAALLQWFARYAYEPTTVYMAIVLLMTASSFGLPVPEEITLVTVGLLGYMASQPGQFPPPYEGAVPVNLYSLMVVTFLAVFLSDFLVYSLGRYGGAKIKNHPRFHAYVKKETLVKVENWVMRYGAWVSGVFRFTPGLRFPGHLMCGALGVRPLQFTLVDGSAALLSVPTQVWLVSTYGEVIMKYFKQFKLVIFAVVVLIVVVFLVNKIKVLRAPSQS